VGGGGGGGGGRSGLKALQDEILVKRGKEKAQHHYVLA